MFIIEITSLLLYEKEVVVLRSFRAIPCIVLIMLLISIVLMPCAPTVSAATVNVTRYGRSQINKLPNSAALLYVYDRLVEGCATPEDGERIDLEYQTHKINKDELKTVVNLFFTDYPEYFWMTNGYTSYSYPGSDLVTAIQPKYVSFDGKTMTGTTQAQAKAELDKKLNELTQGLDGKSQYEKSLILHDRLAATTSYVSNDLDQTAYGALVKGIAVCAGYTKAYQLLLQKVGIASWYVSGDSKKPDENGSTSHAWNLVKIDGEWYYTDVTWDDKDTLYYYYLNLTADRMHEDHIPDKYKAAPYLPSATATAANYHIRNNLCFSKVDVNGFANILKNNHPARVVITGDTSKFKNDLKANFRDIVTKMGIPTTAGYSYKYTNQGREFVITYTIQDSSHVHSLTSIPAKNPTCTASGNIAYYTCGCGKWFKDNAATQEITDKSTVTLPSTAHTESGYKYDANEHWKVCSVCNAEIGSTHAPHNDADRNGNCDVCSAAVKIPTTSSAPSTSSTPTNSTPTNSTPTNSAPSVNTSSQNVPSNNTPSNNTPSYNTPSYGSSSYNNSTSTSPTVPTNTNAATNSLITLWLIIGVVVIGGGVIALIIFKT